MIFVKLDASYFLDPKIERISPLAELLFIRSLCHARAHLTDGRITLRALRMIHPDDTCRAGPLELADELVRAGLWTELDASEDGTGWRIASWDQHNPPSDEIKAKRERDAERKRTARARTRPSDVHADVPADTRGRPDGHTRTSGPQKRREQNRTSLSPSDADASAYTSPDEPGDDIERDRMTLVVTDAINALAEHDTDRRGAAVLDRRAYVGACRRTRREDHELELTLAATVDPTLSGDDLAAQILDRERRAGLDAPGPVSCDECGWTPDHERPHGAVHGEWLAAEHDDPPPPRRGRPAFAVIPGGAA